MKGSTYSLLATWIAVLQNVSKSTAFLPAKTLTLTPAVTPRTIPSPLFETDKHHHDHESNEEVQVNVRVNGDSTKANTRFSSSSTRVPSCPPVSHRNPPPTHTSVSRDAGPLWEPDLCAEGDATIIPHRGSYRKRVLILCTGGTLTMSCDPAQGGSLAPVQGAMTNYLAGMTELTEDPEMPEIVSHEYSPLIDSSDMVRRTGGASCFI